jgi:hypothetical protein
MQRRSTRVASYRLDIRRSVCHTGGIRNRYTLVTIKRIKRIRLYPTPHQRAELSFMLDVMRQL